MKYSTFCVALFAVLCFSGCDENGIVDTSMEMGTVTDREDNIYKTVKIGSQWWMIENLKVTSFGSGDAIAYVESNEEWKNADYPAICAVHNNPSGSGYLYNFHVIMSNEEIAPEGWHVPTDEDWKILEEYLGMDAAQLDKTNWRGSDEGDQMKEKTTTTSGWIFYDGVWGTNASGFSAIGGSCRVFNGEWGVPGLRHTGFWWSSTVDKGYGWYRYLDYKKSGVFRYSAHPNYGFSIRCVKNS